MKTLLKLMGSWVAFFAGLMGAFAAIGALKLHMNPPLDQHSAGVRLLYLLLSGAVLVLGLWPLAQGLAGPAVTRAGALFNFLLLALAVNTMIESSVFTTMMEGARKSTAVYYLCLVVFVGGAMGMLFGEKGARAGLRQMAGLDWLGRGLIAWLCWPVIYFIFGMCVAPIVTPYYRSIPWLHIPSLGTIVGTQLVRSVIFLASSLPLVALWKGSRRGLWMTLGLAHAATVGLFGLAGATFFPMSMRVAHGLEITGDSFAYAGMLVLLFSGAAAARERTTAMPNRAPLQAN